MSDRAIEALAESRSERACGCEPPTDCVDWPEHLREAKADVEALASAGLQITDQDWEATAKEIAVRGAGASGWIGQAKGAIEAAIHNVELAGEVSRQAAGSAALEAIAELRDLLDDPAGGANGA